MKRTFSFSFVHQYVKRILDFVYNNLIYLLGNLFHGRHTRCLVCTCIVMGNVGVTERQKLSALPSKSLPSNSNFDTVIEKPGFDLSFR